MEIKQFRALYNIIVILNNKVIITSVGKKLMELT